MENKYLEKFITEDWIKGDILETEYQRNISIYGNEIYFTNLEFDARFIIEQIYFSCSKDDTLEKMIYQCQGKDKNSEVYPVKVSDIKKYSFSGCKFNDDVYFNLQDYRIIDIEFEGNAKLFDIQFYKMFKNTESEEVAHFTNTIFNKSVIFEKIVFEEFIQFKYTTFKKYTLFRDMEFKQGLDLDYTNIENGINFYNIQGLTAKESIKKTSMETYRIIKYNFEQISNYIEANKFYMLEMNKYQDSIYRKNFWEEMVFSFNNSVSNFGQSWIKPFLIYIVGGLIFTLFIFFIYDYSNTNSFYEILSYSYNPLDKNIINNYNILGLIYKVCSGLILYHLIVSLKRQTKR